jgi:hypothetical protein
LSDPPADTRAIAPPALFGARVVRAILYAALSTQAEEGDVDIPRVIERVAERRPLDGFPRERVPSLRRGAQVLVDFSAGMDPYRGDVDMLLTDLDAIFADDRFTVLRFIGCPSRGVAPVAGGRRAPWTRPAAGTPVVLITDLGIGGPAVGGDRAMPSEWLSFANAVRAAGHPLIAVVPYEARRWPAALTRALTVLHWSERTTVGAIRRARREAGGRR